MFLWWFENTLNFSFIKKIKCFWSHTITMTKKLTRTSIESYLRKITVQYGRISFFKGRTHLNYVHSSMCLPISIYVAMHCKSSFHQANIHWQLVDDLLEKLIRTELNWTKPNLTEMNWIEISTTQLIHTFVARNKI